jgi:Xaa-Pro aminopeptidase
VSAHGGVDPAGARVTRLAGLLDELGLDALLVDSLVDVRYLTGFTGSHGSVLALAGHARARLGRDRFFSDFRYATQSAEQVPDVFAREIVAGDLRDALAAALVGPEGQAPEGAGGERGGRLGFAEASVSVKDHRRLTELLGRAWELVPGAGVVERLRAVKDAGEVARIRAASELADEALRTILEDGLAGRGEREVAIELELRMRRLGAQAPSFPSIVASGAHGALPHAEPREQTIARDVLVTIDWGALLDGYCSDCTRTYATGEGISAQAREIYALVLSAQERGLAAVRAGRSGREVDAIAREVIEQAGEGEHFGHGLGHGVGMEIHEGPRLSRTAPEEPLLAGNVVTVEPGVYLPGVLGVRIEDLVVVGEDAQEVLTSLPKALTVV